MMLMFAVRRCRRWTAAWIFLVGFGGLAGARTLEPGDIYNIYIVDVNAIADQKDEAARYIAYRWQWLIDGRPGAQNGKLILVNGVRSSPRMLYLDSRDATQLDRVRARIEEAVKDRSRPRTTGIELSEAGEMAAEAADDFRDRTLADFHGQNRIGQRLVVVHLIADRLMFRPYRTDSRLYDLLQNRYEDQCFLPPGQPHGIEQSLTDFSNGVSTSGMANQSNVAGLLVLVGAGSRRLSPDVERAAAIAILGKSLTIGRAAAMRDAIGCMENDARIDIGPISGSECVPSRGPPAVATERRADTCPAIGSDQRTGIIAERLSKVVGAILPDGAMAKAIPPVPPSLPPPSPPLTPPTSAKSPPSLTLDPAQSRPAPSVSPPAPPENVVVATAPPTATQSSPSPTHDPAQSPVTMPVRPADPSTKVAVTTPPRIPPPPPPVDSGKALVRSVAVRTAAALPSPSPPNAATLGIRLFLTSVNPGGTQVEIPEGRPLADRPDDGINLLIARIPSTARCDAGGQLVFSVTFVDGGWLPASASGAWVVTIPDGCPGGAVERPFGTVVIGGRP